jgi:hypothetical protein
VHCWPSKQLVPGHEHTLVSWLLAGAQPHAPMEHSLGKSLVAPQHSAIVTIPPDCVQSASWPPLPPLVEPAMLEVPPIAVAPPMPLPPLPFPAPPVLDPELPVAPATANAPPTAFSPAELPLPPAALAPPALSPSSCWLLEQAVSDRERAPSSLLRSESFIAKNLAFSWAMSGHLQKVLYVMQIQTPSGGHATSGCIARFL